MTTQHAARDREIQRRANQRRSDAWFTRSAETIRDEIDPTVRTIGAVIATENPVLVYDRINRRIVAEVLVAAGAQLFSWVPLLNSHQTWDLEYNLGSVLNAARQGQTIRASLSFANSPEVEPVWSRVRDGHLRAVSVGGRRVEFTDIEPGQSATVAGRRWIASPKYPLRVTHKWILRETSVVIFGADGGAATAPD